MKLPIWIILFLTFLMAKGASAAETARAIGWIPTWQQGLEEARLSGKPIMLYAGAPSCSGVPGIW
ncbi:MAG TPA: hypothetical protein PLC15_19255 [Candidatus Obscuribacter sp.]|nr:hypothetical protein [Candidatus Obscuribacter sp.]HMW92749.1 hypothetical protein [Candidatus Obscuribacter sp.]HMY52660.1 hypothetical protein [Candidatus Obscuribacter sp.]HNA74400.1 hypothetical protein [Candidatus Obscuribacter sp.]HNB17530.1 hypothetical protein [Candidatus Obscuribacter sp.]